jgi:spermidine synthase
MIYQTNPIVAMDDNHVDLIKSLVMCNKPKNILEIGIGSGIVTKVLIEASQYNKINVNITCVDNFYDWNGNVPEGFDSFINYINFINSNEKDFVYNCVDKYDFIVSDADHHNTNEWVDKTYDMLNNNGILIYHDVTNKDFPNLYNIVDYVVNNNINYIIFNKSSLPNERCERGLIVIYKKN